MTRGLTRQARERLRWCVSLIAALALLQPTLVAFDLDLSGWRPDHGHLTAAAGAVPAHEHPYDHTHSGERPGAAAGGDQVETSVVFVSSDDATGSPILVIGIVSLAPHLSPSSEVAAAGDDAPLSFVIEPPAPPPRI